MKRRLAFVAQRYGNEVVGGSETHCRQVVERLVPRFDIEVITTCAQDYWTWANEYPTGTTTVNGIPVRRFPALRTRAEDFGLFSARIFGQPHTLAQELKWIHDQGPLVPGLLEYIASHRDQYDVFVFFTYIYYPTVLGLRLVSDKALLVPTAHDEPAIYFDIYKALFHSPRAILYNTHEERTFVQTQFGNEYIPNEVVGVGVEAPLQRDPDRFRQKFGIDKSYILYLGRIVSSKGCDELIEYFQRFDAQNRGALQLVLAGRSEIEIPNSPNIRYIGYVSEEDKFDAMDGALAVMSPSRYESLSMVTLESWMVGRPVVCTSASPVVASMCRRSNGGLDYRNADEFCEILRVLLAQPALPQRLGHNGRQFVQAHYSWDLVEQKYLRMIDLALENTWAGESRRV